MAKTGDVIYRREQFIFLEQILILFMYFSFSFSTIGFIIFNTKIDLVNWIQIIFVIFGFLFILYLSVCDYRYKKAFSITEFGFIFPLKSLRSIYQLAPKTKFVMFSDIESIIYEFSRGLGYSITFNIKGGDGYHLSLAGLEFKEIKRILDFYDIKSIDKRKK